ncbi:MAG: hypothetical protein L0I76_02120 [Pseudonocardia sp.]|nr:hypothetical protein [Pseudonocardia sp.]
MLTTVNGTTPLGRWLLDPDGDESAEDRPGGQRRERGRERAGGDEDRLGPRAILGVSGAGAGLSSPNPTELLDQNPPETLRRVHLLSQPFGVAIRPGHRLAGRDTCALRDLDDVRVLAHAREQVPAEHDRMVIAAHEAGVAPRWHFARFSENALMCAETAEADEADAVLLSATSAARLLPDWLWSELVEPAVQLRTWAVHQPLTRGIVTATARAIGNDEELVPAFVPSSDEPGRRS